MKRLSGMLTGVVQESDEQDGTLSFYVGVMALTDKMMMTPKDARRLARRFIKLADRAEKEGVK